MHDGRLVMRYQHDVRRLRGCSKVAVQERGICQTRALIGLGFGLAIWALLIAAIIRASL